MREECWCPRCGRKFATSVYNAALCPTCEKAAGGARGGIDMRAGRPRRNPPKPRYFFGGPCEGDPVGCSTPDHVEWRGQHQTWPRMICEPHDFHATTAEG